MQIVVRACILLCARIIWQAAASTLVGGYHHSCAIVDNGQVKCWGENDRGQLGLGDTRNRGGSGGEILPALNLGMGRAAKSLAAGREHTCALLDNGKVKCWGDDSRRRRAGRSDIGLNGQLGPLAGNISSRGDAPGTMGDSLQNIDLGTGRSAQLLVAGEHHNCALLDNGQVKCWGRNREGQLGLGGTTNRGTDANQMGDALPAVNLGKNSTAVLIAAGIYHTCALLLSKQLKCWGHNDRGQLGVGDQGTRGDHAHTMGEELEPVNLGTGRTATHVVSSGAHTCALLDNRKVKCWGENAQGQLGLGDKEPRGYRGGQMGDRLPEVDLGTGRTATSLATGIEHTCALLDNGQVKCWGHNHQGQLGLGNKDTTRGDAEGQMGDSLASVDLGSGRTAKVLAAGYHHTIALLDNGKLKFWGYNGAGQLGLGDIRSRGHSPEEMGNALPHVNLQHTGRNEL